jgi:hypothetical protein
MPSGFVQLSMDSRLRGNDGVPAAGLIPAAAFLTNG